MPRTSVARVIREAVLACCGASGAAAASRVTRKHRASSAHPCVAGRRPAGLVPYRPGRAPPVVRFLGRMVYLEAASIPAFERLARELAAHGAPQRLQRAARRALRDEERHTRMASALADHMAGGAAGARAARPRVRKGRVRSLEAIARENAVEGCVLETYAAAVAMAQSMSAAQPRVRRAMRKIGADEMRHADLAWDVARWLDRRLTPEARARVVAARRGAGRALVKSAGRPVHPNLVAQLGLPAAPAARALAADLASCLWDDDDMGWDMGDMR